MRSEKDWEVFIVFRRRDVRMVEYFATLWIEECWRMAAE